jgi:hypothetical protein
MTAGREIMKTAFALFTVLAFAGSASARSVYEKPLLENNDNGAFSYVDQLIADDFTLTAGASISQATWYGAYSFSFDPFNTGDTVDFVVRFFNPAGDRPELSAFFEQAVTATVTDTGVNTLEGPRRYLFSASFDAVALAGNTTYYFSVEEVDADTAKPDFRWNNGAIDGDDDNIAFRVGGQWSLDSGGSRSATAFTLNIPAPSAFGLGVAAAVFAGRRRR